MVKLSEMELKRLVKGGETNTVELKLAAPRAMEMAERLCGMTTAHGMFLNRASEVRNLYGILFWPIRCSVCTRSFP
jgi:hypothetical protein